MRTKDGTPLKIQELASELLGILGELGIPLDGTDRALERMVKACLAVGKIKASLAEAKSIADGEFSRTRDIIAYENANYGENISSGSYDDIRRKDLRLLVEAGIVVNSSMIESQATNNPSRGYALSVPFVALLQKYDTPYWAVALSEYRIHAESLKEDIRRKRNLAKVPVILPGGKNISLSYGSHNDLQKAIIEVFLPLFGFGAEVLYIGDTSDKFLYLDREKLEEINFFTLEHEELPDIVAYSKSHILLYLIEAYHSTGEWDEARLSRIKRKLYDSKCTANTVFFTAFENKEAFRRKAKDIAWETEVWIADNPEHLIHFNGYKFLEVNKKAQ